MPYWWITRLKDRRFHRRPVWYDTALFKTMVLETHIFYIPRFRQSGPCMRSSNPAIDEVTKLFADNELIYCPGKWKYPDGKEGLRITRVYVSSKETIEFGENKTCLRLPCRS
jgi:hypothetical protein